MIRLGDCVELLAEFEDGSVDAVVADPPYGINFMGKAWDGKAIEAEVAKGDRWVHQYQRLTGSHDSPNRKLVPRTGSAYRNRAGEAGAYDFTLRGNRAFGAWCEVWGTELLRVLKPGGHALVFGGTRTHHRLATALEEVGFEIRDELCWLFGSGFPKSLNLDGDWQGWGTALKPAHEPIVVARKPFRGTVAANVLEHGTGALHVDACRVDVDDRTTYERNHSGDRGHEGTREPGGRGSTDLRPGGGSAGEGRWPANVVLDEEAAALLDEQTGELPVGVAVRHRSGGRTFGGEEPKPPMDDLGYGGAGGASRFFYCAKTSVAERNAGLEDERNHHPTVKPVSLMRWLVRLVTPPGGLVLDPFAGSGTTGIACALEGLDFLGIEREPDYATIAEARIAFWREHGEDALRIVRDRDAAERERWELADSGQLDLLGEP